MSMTILGKEFRMKIRKAKLQKIGKQNFYTL